MSSGFVRICADLCGFVRICADLCGFVRFEGVAPGGADALFREADRLEYVFRWDSDVGAQRQAAAAFMLQGVADACAEWSRRNGRIGELHVLSDGGDVGLSRLSAMALSAGLELGPPGAAEWVEASAPA